MNPNKDDWIEQLDKDKKELNLLLEDDELKSIKEEQFREIVMAKIEICAGKYLEEIRFGHTKTEKIKFEGFKPSSYLMSRNLSTREIQTLFSLRTRMVDVKGNFSSGNTDNLWCKLCSLFKETQQHLLECPEIRLRTKNLVNFKELDYQMIFGSMTNQEKITKSYQIISEARKELLDPN